MNGGRSADGGGQKRQRAKARCPKCCPGLCPGLRRWAGHAAAKAAATSLDVRVGAAAFAAALITRFAFPGQSPGLRLEGAPSRALRSALCALLSALLVLACEREQRRFTDSPPPPAENAKRLVTLVPGPVTPDVKVENPYGYNAQAISEGKRLFTWYNCVGCHANGGGGMGPALMDERWIYGSDPENVFATIVEGRPNGMPAFRGKIPTRQVWQLVAYVHSLSGNVPKDAASGREDGMQVRKQDQALPDLVPEKEAAQHP